MLVVFDQEVVICGRVTARKGRKRGVASRLWLMIYMYQRLAKGSDSESFRAILVTKVSQSQSPRLVVGSIQRIHVLRMCLGMDIRAFDKLSLGLGWSEYYGTARLVHSTMMRLVTMDDLQEA
jgi:hypothetical protein